MNWINQDKALPRNSGRYEIECQKGSGSYGMTLIGKADFDCESGNWSHSGGKKVPWTIKRWRELAA